jgi:hypothetical protein
MFGERQKSHTPENSTHRPRGEGKRRKKCEKGNWLAKGHGMEWEGKRPKGNQPKWRGICQIKSQIERAFDFWPKNVQMKRVEER